MTDDHRTAPGEPIGVYIHIPFCRRKCPYCDFNTYAGLEDRWTELVDALCMEIDAAPEEAGRRSVDTVFVGGGTPTVLAPAAIGRLVDAVGSRFRIAPGAEISCEANPGASDSETFAGLLSAGVNRLSIGVQSLDERELTWLGRIHDAGDAVRAVEAARAAGFRNLSLDLMFGLPGQARTSWRRTLEGAVALRPEHLSLYSLIVEPGTPLAEQVARGAVDVPGDDVAAEHYRDAIALLHSGGFAHYEVSNWARTSDALSAADGDESSETDRNGPSETALGALSETSRDGLTSPAHACRHNLIYWRNGEYVGFGPGAHSHLRLEPSDEPGRPGGSSPGPNMAAADRRWANVKGVDAYIEQVTSGLSAVASEEWLSPRQAMGETMLLGLRLLEEGVPHARFAALHGIDVLDAFGEEIERLTAMRLLSDDGIRLRLTDRGLMVGNQVFAEFVE